MMLAPVPKSVASIAQNKVSRKHIPQITPNKSVKMPNESPQSTNFASSLPTLTAMHFIAHSVRFFVFMIMIFLLR